MKGLLFFIPFLLFGWFTPLNAQFLQIDFSESSINDWFGDTDKFLIVNEQLRLNDASAGSSNISYLSIPAPTSIGESTSWESWVYLDFSPSASNFARIYLTASQADLSASLNGYFLQVGGISGDQDAVELYRQDGDTPVLLISATAGAVGGTSALANIRVIRTEEGEWTLQADYTGGTNYQSEGTVTDKTYGMGNYFGYYCRYSSTRSDAFYFDDLLVNPIFQDQTPPDILAATSIDARTLAVTFNEAVDPASASQLSIYEIVPGPGLPQTALRSEEDPTVVLLTWATSFTNLQTYSLTVTGIRDLAGNQSGELSIDFTYVELAFPQTGDLLITEMLPDPSPPLGLPNAEFVEVYNASDKVLALEGIGLSSGGSPKILPAYQMLPNTYLILCDEADVNAFSAFGPALGLDGFPALTNGGDQITLTNEDGAVLVSLTYDLSWYKDSEKQDGGWSLELIRTDQSIDCVGNWSASNAANGGTPGQENSVKNNPLEGQGPILLSVYVASPTEIVLRFDETLDPIAATDPDAYSISGGLSITNARLGGVPSEIVLELSSALEPGTIYEVQTGTSITDCLGNQSESAVSRRVGLAETAAEGDLVINELLYMPEVGGADFVEIYNRSQKIVNLNGWQVRNRQEDGILRQERIATDFLVFPGEYAVITEDPQDISSRYTVPFPERMLKNDLPTISDVGQLSLLNDSFTMIDSFSYSSALHSPLLADERGVSLERVDPESPTNSPGNWHSAAGTAGFATPTSENSQYIPLPPEDSQNIIQLSQKRFSPDGDGFEDVLLLDVATDRSGYLASIQIFDANGRLVRRLMRNELLPTKGLYKWDGSRDDGNKARLGIYVIWVELVHPDGTVEHWKESCVLAGQLE